ncbi:Programmed cell death protein 2-like protein [Dorcoceras hygrometricum]|uniref:Programmed cell death protein 2-like protein n=1 Tax=Dorcoceras hygrometricum TaxID=472368 RepID=A0A2Z6ZSL9_9LAMI|nr:Programmed cell death protein 2-like protein [Dorcoceras hygrometricum]
MAGRSYCCFAQVLHGVAPTSCCSFSHGGRPLLQVAGAIVSRSIAHRMRHWLAHRTPCAARVAASVRPSAARYVVAAAAAVRPPSGDAPAMS